MRKIFVFLVTFVATIVMVSCGQSKDYEYPFQNPKLSNDDRVENLISILTPEEKIGLIMNKSISVDRLGIPSYNWWSEACHGIRQSGYTVYPQAIGMAATFNPDLIYNVFSTVSDEARANWNRSDRNIFNVPMGSNYVPGNPELSFWCPNINIFRDPRWGRGQETSGEDPYLSAVMGVQTVKGMQGNDKKYFKTHACAKHYAVHSGPEPLRHRFDVTVSMRDLWETYLPAFKATVIEGNVQEIMCAYQRYEGEPCCSSTRLLIDILRNKWGYKSLVVTDCDGINNFYNRGQHETHPDAAHASADALLSGTDLECGKSFMSLIGGLEDGLIKESDIDVALRRVLKSRFELGMFDPAEKLPWANFGEDVISSKSNDQLAIQTARESMVLLKNDNNVLPLSKDLKTIAVVGPNADDAEMLNGNYGGTPIEEHKRTLLEGIINSVPNTKIIYEKACELTNEYSTTYHNQSFNDGKGLFVEFFNNTSLSGKAAVEGYYSTINFSTFGAYEFAEGVDKDAFSVRITGKYVSSFSGDMSYNIASDNGYKLTINGKVVEDIKGSTQQRGGFGFGRRGGGVSYKTFPVQEGKSYDVKIEYVKGTSSFAMLNTEFNEMKIAEFSELAEQLKDVDAIIVIGGISARMEGEGGDRADIELPKVQQRLVRAMRTTGKPVVMVNCSGSAIGFESVESSYDALIQAWYGGQGGSQALADIIFGDYNPSGKLPVTFYSSTAQLPDFEDYNMEGRTYRYFRDTPLYAFGYGLSYTTFNYGEAKLSKSKIKAGDKVNITVPVTNTGAKDGCEVVQIYVKSLDNPEAPIKALKGFKKVKITAGSTAKVKITLKSDAFEYYDASVDDLSVRSGKYQILYGSSSKEEDLQALYFEVI